MNRQALLIGVLAGVAIVIWRQWRPAVKQGRRWEPSDMVAEASDESFPASDAPAHTVLTGSRVDEGLA